ncbi:MAG: GntR family transcriptional regulator [Methyloligellaceae bacterium]
MSNQPSRLVEIPKSTRRIRGVSAVQQIYERLREQIVELSLPPGSVISKNELAAEFGVSPTPVRDALLRLEDEGLIEIFPQSRTVVSYIDVQSAREAHFLRRSVEVEIARILSLDITEGQTAELRAVITQQAANLKVEDFSAFTASDDQFHERMYAFAGVGGLWSLIRTRRAHLDRLRHLHLPARGKAKAILKDHKTIIDAVAAHDAEGAERAVREHLKGTVSATEEIRSHFPEYFE